jgi:3-hydroxybutyrate dehydrogenase
MRLQDKVAIVTGAASGIGKEIAVIFAHEGAKVAIADLDQKAADTTAREIDSTGKRAIGVAMDVANEQQVDDGTAKVVKTFGALDVLVSNAGIQIVAPIVDFELAKWKRLLSIHLDGAFLTTRAALRQMYKQKSGSIIYMGSVHSKEASVLALCHGQTRLDRPCESCRQRGGRTRRPRQRDLPRLRAHPAGRQTDT